MGLGAIAQFLGNAITPATNVAAANLNAQAEENNVKRQMALQAYGLQRQSSLDTSMKALQNSEAFKNQREGGKLQLGDPGYSTAMGDVAGSEAMGKVPAAVSQAQQLSPITTTTAANTAAATAPIEVKKATDIAAATAPIDVKKAVGIAQGTTPIKSAGEIAVNAAKVPGEMQVAQARAGMAPRVQSAAAALPQLDSALTTLQKYNQPGAAGRLFSKSALGSYAISPEGQVANQAANQFAQAYLSGRGMRNAPPAQVQAVVKQIQVQPGEEGNAAVIASKQQRLQSMRDEVAKLGMTTTDPAASSGAAGGGKALSPVDAAHAQHDTGFAAWAKSQGYIVP